MTIQQAAPKPRVERPTTLVEPSWTYGWRTSGFKTKEGMQAWIDKNDHRIQWEQVFVNNGYAIMWRRLRRIY
jgi:hypothetical protein